MTAPVMREAVKVIGDIIQAELEMDNGQIMLTNQKWNIPQNTKLFVALGYVSGKAIANRNDSISNGPGSDAGMTEQQSIVMHYVIRIDAMAFNKQNGGNEARERKEEIMMALRSLKAQAEMEKNNLQVARISSEFLDVSSLEETAFLTRYTMTIAVTALRVKEKAVVDYYSDFNAPEVTINE